MEPDMFKEDVSLGKQNRIEISTGLVRLHADSYTLYLQTRNLKEKAAATRLNRMLEAQCEDLANAVHVIAEHIRALDISATVIYKEFSNINALLGTGRVRTSKDMFEFLSLRHEQVLNTAIKILQLTKLADAKQSASLVSDRILIHEKTIWLLRAKETRTGNTIVVLK